MGVTKCQCTLVGGMATRYDHGAILLNHCGKPLTDAAGAQLKAGQTVLDTMIAVLGRVSLKAHYSAFRSNTVKV